MASPLHIQFRLGGKFPRTIYYCCRHFYFNKSHVLRSIQLWHWSCYLLQYLLSWWSWLQWSLIFSWQYRRPPLLVATVVFCSSFLRLLAAENVAVSKRNKISSLWTRTVQHRLHETCFAGNDYTKYLAPKRLLELWCNGPCLHEQLRERANWFRYSITNTQFDFKIEVYRERYQTSNFVRMLWIH